MNSNSNTTPILFITLIIVIVFSNSLKSDFAWDDKYLIVSNPYVKDFSYLPKVFTSQLYDGSGIESNFYRPLQLFSFAIDYSIWKLNPFGYHLTSLLLHIFNSALVYYTVFIICSSFPIAFLAALMFGVSPAISGAAYYISARADLLMAFFVFLSILFFIKYRETRKKVLYVISIISFILSMLCKEMAMILPFLLVIEVFRNRGKKISLRPLFLYFIILFLYIFLRVNFTTASSGFTDQSFPAGIPLWKRILTDFNVIVVYIRLLLFPSGLHMQRFIKPAEGLFKTDVLLAAALIAFLIVVIRRLSRNDKIFLYAAAWFFVCLLPVLNIYPISVFLHEMWLYLPSVGFYMFFSAFIVKIIAKKINKIAAILFITSYVTYYCLTTIAYGKTWHDSISLFSNDLKYETTSPFRHLLYNNAAMAYYNKGEFEKSIEYCKKSILLDPKYSEPYNNLGISYIAVKKPVRAIFFLKRAIQLKRGYVDAYCNLGHAYKIIGMQDKAIEISKTAIGINPRSYGAYCNLGYVYSEKGEIDKAIESFKKASRIRKKEYEPHYCMGSLYIKKNNYEEALKEYKKALEFGLGDSDLYNALAFVYIKNNKFKEAEDALMHSIALNNNQFEPHNNLGNLYSMFGYHDLAIKEYREALDIEPGNKGIISNIEKVKREKKQALHRNAKP
jgi:tetratricopeptide (TPR) repeat protein